MLCRRILLKLSGEALAGSRGYGFDPAVLDALAGEEILGMQTATLVSINGATNASKFVELYDKVKEKPKEILLALDNDEPGERARQEIENALRWKWCRVKTVHNHVRAGVKDMHRLLTANH